MAPTTAANASIPTTSSAIGMSGTTGSASVPGALPDGIYVVEVTDDDLAAVNFRVDEYPENHGTFTWTMAGGTWTWLQTADNLIHNPSDAGTYVVDGDHIIFNVTGDLGPQEFSWVTNPDGNLQFTALPSTSKYFTAYAASQPWH